MVDEIVQTLVPDLLPYEPDVCLINPEGRLRLDVPVKELVCRFISYRLFKASPLLLRAFP